MTSVMPNTQTTQGTPPPAKPVDMAEVERKVSKAKSLLIIDHPFFGTGVSRRPIQYTDTVPTAAMSATGQMYINPRFIEDGTPENGPLTVKNVMFLLAHEAMHYMLMHGLRMQHRNHKAWNVATDKVINDTLIDAKVGDFIKGGIHMRDARNFAAEELYDENDQGQNGNGPGGIGNDVQPPTNGDGSPMDASQVRQAEAQAKIEAVQCAKAAKAVGKLPGSLERMIDELVQVSTPWYDHLERHMTSFVAGGKSWKRPNKRMISKGIYLKGKSKQPRMGKVVIGVDTSGSIGQAELNFFGGHVNRILETCQPEEVIVIYCDAAVAHVDRYEPDDMPIRLTPHGGGGTRFEPVFDYIDEHDIEPEVVVYLTDGYGSSDFTTHHETVWLTTHSEQFKFGTVIKAEFE